MPYVPLDRFLFRAPLLPLRALGDARAALAASRLGEAALRLASPDLAAALGRKRVDARARAAIGRYARRAAFRPTPSGFWAGVGVGRLGRGTQIRTPSPSGDARFTRSPSASAVKPPACAIRSPTRAPVARW